MPDSLTIMLPFLVANLIYLVYVIVLSFSCADSGRYKNNIASGCFAIFNKLAHTLGNIFEVVPHNSLPLPSPFPLPFLPLLLTSPSSSPSPPLPSPPSLPLPLLQGFVLGSFYWGYLCAPLLGHFLSERYGGETVQWVAAIGWSLGTMLTVQFAPYSQVAVIVLRFVCGFAQGKVVSVASILHIVVVD